MLAAFLAGAWTSASVAEPSPKFDPATIARLLAQRERQGGLTTQDRAALRPGGLTTEDRIALMSVVGARLQECWLPPAASATAFPPRLPIIEIMLKPDGSLAAEPRVANASPDPLFQEVAATAIRAIKRCAPLRIPTPLRPFYEDWKRLLINFDPRGRR